MTSQRNFTHGPLSTLIHKNLSFEIQFEFMYNIDYNIIMLNAIMPYNAYNDSICEVVSI